MAEAEQVQDKGTDEAAQPTQEAPMLQDWVPLTHCFDWHLGQMAFQQRGAQAFTTNEVPNLINQGGMSAYRAAEVLYANCAEAADEGDLEADICCLEMAIGLGLHSLQLLDRFKEICERNKRDYYERLTWYATDITPKMLHDARDNGVFERHAGRVVLGQLDALQPQTLWRLDDGEPVQLQGRLRAIFHTYMLCVLPANVFRRSEVTLDSGEQRVVWGVLMARTILRHHEELSSFTDLDLDTIRAMIDSGASEQHLALTHLYPLLDLDLTLAPLDESSHPDLWELERIAHTIRAEAEKAGADSGTDTVAAEHHTWVLHSAGAMQSLDNSLALLQPSGMIVYRDYGPASAAAANGTHLYQHYGATTAIGVNHFALDRWLQEPGADGDRRALVTGADGEGEAAIKTRLVARAAMPKTRAVFRERFDPKDFDELTATIQRAHGLLEKPGEAMEAYRLALAMERDNWALLAEAAEVALRYGRNLEMAHMLVNEVLRINPWYCAAAWNVLGDICWFAEDIDRSEAAYNKAVECNPEHYRGYFNLYTIHRQRCRYDKAVEMAAMALAMDRNGVESERTMAALDDASRLLRQQRKLAIEWRKARHAGSPL